MSDQSPQIAITERAELDLDELTDYIAEQAGEKRAIAIVRTISEKIRLQAVQPRADR